MYDVVMQRLDNWTPLTNAAIGPSPAQRRAATSENPTACTPYVRNIPQLDAPPMKYRTPTYWLKRPTLQLSTTQRRECGRNTEWGI